jgi:hypothetical protein
VKLYTLNRRCNQLNQTLHIAVQALVPICGLKNIFHCIFILPCRESRRFLAFRGSSSPSIPSSSSRSMEMERCLRFDLSLSGTIVFYEEEEKKRSNKIGEQQKHMALLYCP